MAQNGFTGTFSFLLRFSCLGIVMIKLLYEETMFIINYFMRGSNKIKKKNKDCFLGRDEINTSLMFKTIRYGLSTNFIHFVNLLMVNWNSFFINLQMIM